MDDPEGKVTYLKNILFFQTAGLPTGSGVSDTRCVFIFAGNIIQQRVKLLKYFTKRKKRIAIQKLLCYDTVKA